MAQMLQKPVFALPGCQRMSVNTLLCDTLGLADRDTGRFSSENGSRYTGVSQLHCRVSRWHRGVAATLSRVALTKGCRNYTVACRTALCNYIPFTCSAGTYLMCNVSPVWIGIRSTWRWKKCCKDQNTYPTFERLMHPPSIPLTMLDLRMLLSELQTHPNLHSPVSVGQTPVIPSEKVKFGVLVPIWVVLPWCEATNLGAFDLCHFDLFKWGCANSGGLELAELQPLSLIID